MFSCFSNIMVYAELNLIHLCIVLSLVRMIHLKILPLLCSYITMLQPNRAALNFYRPHPKDGGGNVFPRVCLSVCVSVHICGGTPIQLIRGYPLPRSEQGWGGAGVHIPRSGWGGGYSLPRSGLWVPFPCQNGGIPSKVSTGVPSS